jgi:putative MATE family efflux protein
VIAVAASTLNLALELALVYGLDTGIAGSAWGTVVAQAVAAVAFVVIVERSARRDGASMRPRAEGVKANAVVGSQLVVRTGSLLLALLLTTAAAARISDVAVAAHQIAFQIWTFLALALDAVAIAGQALVGRFLGASDEDGARGVSRRMIEWGVLAGLGLGALTALLRPVVVPIFTNDPAVRDLAEQVLWVVAALQPVAGAVFVLDGILIGAGDSRFLAMAMVGATLVYIPVLVTVAALGGGLLALWGALSLWVAARLVGLAVRFVNGRWAVTGAVRGVTDRPAGDS